MDVNAPSGYRASQILTKVLLSYTAAPRTSQTRDLRHVVEVRVAGEEMELVLHDKCCYPEVVRRDRGALPAQLME